jgi:hypothetical protein
MRPALRQRTFTREPTGFPSARTPCPCHATKGQLLTSRALQQADCRQPVRCASAASDRLTADALFADPGAEDFGHDH